MIFAIDHSGSWGPYIALCCVHENNYTFRLCSGSTEDEYLSGMLRIRIMSATDIKAKTGIYFNIHYYS